MKILLVCLGNICRSPTAEAILRSKAKERGLDITIESAGTGGWHAGRSPDPRAIRAAASRGYDLSEIRARQVVKDDFDTFDLILSMDEDNFETLHLRAPNEAARVKVKPILSILSGGPASVPDPFYGGDGGFEHVLDLLEEATDRWLDQLTTSPRSNRVD